jgi:para-aminobenzoate synthetase/4-amino-4-deoxychorismate lyase
MTSHDPIASEGPNPLAGVFETLLIARGRPVELEAHLHRLARSVAELYGHELPATVPGQVTSACDRVRAVAGRLRIAYTPADPSPVSITATEERDSYITRGSPAELHGRPLSLPDGLGAHKWRDRRLLEGVDGDDRIALVCDQAGLVLEAGHANVFLVERDRLVTPALEGRALPGITRARVLALAKAAGIETIEEPVSYERLASADDVLLTSSIRGVHRLASCAELGRWPQASPIVAFLGGRLRSEVTTPERSPSVGGDAAVTGARRSEPAPIRQTRRRCREG